jgi:ankyrin repeat protein
MEQLRLRIKQKREAAKREGRIEETPALRRRRWEKMAAEHMRHQDIRKKFEDMLSHSDEHVKDELMLSLSEEFLEAAERGNEDALQIFIEEGFPVTWQDPENGSTALHIATACQARGVFRVLLKNNDMDFLLRDHKGRLASEMAYLYGDDVAVARLLGNKERKQADAQGIKLTRRPKSE